MPLAFLFDLDQTLINRNATVELYIKEQYLRTGLGQRFSYDRYRDRFMELDQNGYGDKLTLFQTLKAEFDLPHTVEALIADFYSHAWVHCQTFADARDTLTQLRKRNCKLGIVTNGSSRSQRAKLTASGLPAYVDTILISEEEGIKKPEPEIFLRAVQRLFTPITECVFIGDNPEADIGGARQAGMKSVWIKRHATWPQNLEFAPDYTISTLADLLQIPFQDHV